MAEKKRRSINSLDDMDLANVEGTQYDVHEVTVANGDTFVFHIGSVSAGDVIDWQEKNEGPAKKNAGLMLIAKSLVTEDTSRERYAAAYDSKSVAALRAIPHPEYEKLIKVILKLNGFKDDKKDDKKDEPKNV